MFIEAGSGRPISFELRDVVLAGYTGRDTEAVQRHIDELATHGVAPPARVPTFYRVSCERVTTADRIDVLGPETSGEAEFILVSAEGELFVGVGSDHTDRGLERDSVCKAKQLCAKVVSPELWRYADVRASWNELALRSYCGDERADTPYQDGFVADMMPPEDLLESVMRRTGRTLDGVLVFSGTLPMLNGLVCSPRFAVELAHEQTGLVLRVGYSVNVIDLLD